MFFSTILTKKKTSKYQIKQHYINTTITINDGIKLIILMNVIFSWQTRSFLFWNRNSFCMIWKSSNTKDILSGKEFYITNLKYNVTTEKVCYVKNPKMASALLPLKTEFRFLSKLCEGIRDKKVECNFVFLDPIKVQFWSFLKVNAITIFHIFLQKSSSSIQ